MYQTPPPAGVMYAGHLFGVHFGPSAIDDVRPPATYAFGTYRPEVRSGSNGYRASLGPTFTHSPFLPRPPRNGRLFDAANAVRAAFICATEIVSSGYARCMNACCAAEAGPSFSI